MLYHTLSPQQLKCSMTIPSASMFHWGAWLSSQHCLSLPRCAATAPASHRWARKNGSNLAPLPLFWLWRPGGTIPLSITLKFTAISRLVLDWHWYIFSNQCKKSNNFCPALLVWCRGFLGKWSEGSLSWSDHESQVSWCHLAHPETLYRSFIWNSFNTRSLCLGQGTLQLLFLVVQPGGQVHHRRKKILLDANSLHVSMPLQRFRAVVPVGFSVGIPQLH